MRRWHKLVPVFAMGSLVIAYVLARPALAARVPHLTILEFPLGALFVVAILWSALARRRPPRVPSWRKHQQVVRIIPDPALAPYLSAIERWLETGEGHDAAAEVLARAVTNDPLERERVRAKLVTHMQIKASRRKRESLLTEQIEGV